MVLRSHTSKTSDKVVYLFPGQGAQTVGMGLELYQGSSAARAVFDEVADALGAPLSKLIFEGPEEELTRTVNAQPAIMTVSLACLKAMEETLDQGSFPAPSLLAGHSLGEYTAVAASGAIDIGDAARLVRERGRLMQEACDNSSGSMGAIIGLDEITLEEVCRETSTYISNINSEEQIVISGEKVALAHAMDLASARGASRVIPLNVSGAFHSGLMEPAREGLVQAIASLRFREPKIPIVANCTGEPLASAEAIKEELISQICSCVQWKRSVHYMISSGVSTFIELGPGKVLTGLVRKMHPEAKTANINNVSSILAMAS